MKRRNFIKVAGVTVSGLAMTAYLPAGFAWGQDKKWVIGFSQATTIEPWRAQFNKDIIAEAAKHPDVELIITDGEDKTEKQVADVENLIRQEVDALLISPKESAGLTGVVEQAIDADIPVFVLDRNVDTDKYAQFVGGDNALIGRAAGKYAVELLGGEGKAAGNVVEIWGGLGTQPAHDRHDGFHEFTDKEPGIKYLLDQQSGDWKQDQAYDIMETALRSNEKIDLVYGHNDPMAYGAYLAAKDAGRQGRDEVHRRRRPARRGGDVGAQRRADRDLPLRHPGRRGPASGAEVPQRRGGAEDRDARHPADHQGQRRRDPEGERPDLIAAGRGGSAPRPAPWEAGRWTG